MMKIGSNNNNGGTNHHIQHQQQLHHLSPAERRRKAARQQLEETSQITAILMAQQDKHMHQVLALSPKYAIQYESEKQEQNQTTISSDKQYKLASILLSIQRIRRSTTTTTGTSGANETTELEKLKRLLSCNNNNKTTTKTHHLTRFLWNKSLSSPSPPSSSPPLRSKKGKKQRAKNKSSGKKNQNRQSDDNNNKNDTTVVVVDAVTKETPWPIHYVAAHVGSEHVMKILVDYDFDSLDYVNDYGQTVLHLAVQYNHLHLVRYLCKIKSFLCRLRDINNNNNNGGNLPLHVALEGTCDPLITSTLLAQYPSSILLEREYKNDNSSTTSNSDDIYLPIHIAAQHGFTAGIRALLAMNNQMTMDRTKILQLLPVDLACTSHQYICEKLQQQLDNHHNSNETTTTVQQEEEEEAENDNNKNKEDQVESSTTKDDSKPPQQSQPIWLTKLTSKDELLQRKNDLEECIEMLLMSSLYHVAIFMPRDDEDEYKFLPLHAAILCGPITIKSWKHLLKLYGKRHDCDLDNDGRCLLHACADVVASASTTTSTTNDEDKKDDDDDSTNTTNIMETYSDEQLCHVIHDLIHHYNDTRHRRASNNNSKSSSSLGTFGISNFALIKDNYGLNPLQLAVLNGASSQVLQAFIECGAEALKAKWVL